MDSGTKDPGYAAASDEAYAPSRGMREEGTVPRLRSSPASLPLAHPRLSFFDHPWPELDSEALFDEYARELADRPARLKELNKLRRPFIHCFPTLPGTWPPLRDFLNETYTGPTGRTKRNRFDAVKSLYQFGVVPLHWLPYNPMERARRPEANSRPASPIDLDLLERVHGMANRFTLRDRALWLLLFGLGWRPIECTRLRAGDVRRAVAANDGFIEREQKHRAGKAVRSRSPVVPEVLLALKELADTQQHLADQEPLLRGTAGRHLYKPLGYAGIRGVIRQLFRAANVYQERPDAIPYDLRDSFATIVGRAVRASGGSVSEAKAVADRLLGHGDGDDVLRRYYDDDERDTELARFGPLAVLYARRDVLGADPNGTKL